MGKNERRVGALRDRLHFQNRATADDGWGSSVPGGVFETVFTADVALIKMSGSETVIAQQLQGIQSYSVTTRWSVRMTGITNGWQLKGARANDNRIFNVISIPTDPDGKRQWLEFVVTEGKPS